MEKKDISMPYIKKEDREKFALSLGTIHNPGELNYLITQLLVKYQKNKGLSYQTINDIIGVLECAKQEYYRRVATPYEHLKIKEHGDVYDES